MRGVLSTAHLTIVHTRFVAIFLNELIATLCAWNGDVIHDHDTEKYIYTTENGNEQTKKNRAATVFMDERKTCAQLYKVERLHSPNENVYNS